MTHNDPVLWQFFSNIAERVEQMREGARQQATSTTFPPDLKVKASMLTYHLRQAYNEARDLAGEKPDAIAAGD